MNMLIKLHEFIETCVATNPLSLEEDVHVMAICDECFYLWLRVNELFKLKMKQLQRDVSAKPSLDYKCHLIVLFF